MKTGLDYLEAARLALGGVKDNALAESIGISTGAICDAKKHSRPLPPIACFHLAQILNIDAREILAAVEYQKETKCERREFWARTFRSISCTTLAVVAAAGIVIGSDKYTEPPVVGINPFFYTTSME